MRKRLRENTVRGDKAGPASPAARRDSAAQDMVTGRESVSTCTAGDCRPPLHCNQRRSRILLVKQKLFYGVWQRQRGDQMEAVFAERSSHSHTAQIQQGPGDTWNGWEERERQREGGLIQFLPYRSDQRLVGTAGRIQQCLLPASQFQRRAGAGDKGLLPAPSSAQGAKSSLSKHLLTSRQRNRADHYEP